MTSKEHFNAKKTRARIFSSGSPNSNVLRDFVVLTATELIGQGKHTAVTRLVDKSIETFHRKPAAVYLVATTIAESYSKIGHKQNVEKYCLIVEKCLDRIKVKEVKRDGNYFNGVFFSNIGQHSVAIKYFSRALSIAVKLNDLIGEQDCNCKLGLAHCQLQEYDKAIKFSERSICIALETGKPSVVFASYHNIGNCYFGLQQYEKAVEYLEKAHSNALETNDRAGVGGLSRTIGAAYMRLGRNKQAFQFLRNFFYVSIDETHGVLDILANEFIELGQYKELVDLCEECLSISRDREDRKLEGESLVNLGNAYIALEQYEKTIDPCEKSLSISLELGDQLLEGTSRLHLGIVHLMTGLYEEAVKFLETSYTIGLIIGDRSLEGCSCANLGNAYFKLGQSRKAIEVCEKGFAISLSVEVADLEQDCSVVLANAYSELKEYKTAVSFGERALSASLRTGNRIVQGRICKFLGKTYCDLGQYVKAIHINQNLLSAALEMGDGSLESHAYDNMGKVYCGLGKPEKAVEFHKKALVINLALGDQLQLWHTYLFLSSAYRAMGKREDRVEVALKCLSVSKELGDRSLEYFSHFSLGDGYVDLYQYQKAVDYFLEGLSISIEIGNRQREAVLSASLGTAYMLLGQTEVAIKFTERSLSLSIELEDRVQEAACYCSLGQTYKNLGQYHKAMEVLRKGIPLCVEMGLRLLEGSCNELLGELCRLLGRYEEAVECSNKSLSISLETGEQSLEGRSLLHLGDAYFRLNQFAASIDAYEKRLSLELVLENGDQLPEAECYLGLGLAYYAIRKDKEGIQCCEKLLSLNTWKLEDIHFQAKAQRLYGTFYKRMAVDELEKRGVLTLLAKKNLLLAVSWLRKAIQFSDSAFFDLAAHLTKIDVSRICLSCQFEMMSCFLLLGRAEAALLAVDLGKAKTLQLVTRQRNKWAELEKASDAFRGETWQQIGEEKENERLTELISNLQLSDSEATVLVYAFDETLLHFWVLNHGGNVRHLTWKPYGVDTVAQDWLLTQANRMLRLFSVIVSSDYSLFFQSKKENVPDKQESAPCSLKATGPSCISETNSAGSLNDEDQSGLTQGSARQMTKGSRDSERQFVDISRDHGGLDGDNCSPSNDDLSLHSLYQALIHPIRDLIKGKKLIIVPDGLLSLVPFCSLLDEDGHYVSECYSVQMTPSLHTLISSMVVPTPTTIGPALFVGNPTVGEVSLDGKEISVASRPNATSEARALASLFDATPLVEETAIKGRVLKRIQDASVIHISAYADHLRGAVFLSPDRVEREVGDESVHPPTEESFLLQEADISELQLSASLVVLCCRRTGHGEQSPEGVLGLARAFLGAGARAVLVSLWAIPERPSSEFMKLLYAKICQQASICEALKSTMNLFQQHDDTEYRLFPVWAPFVIFGEDVKFTKENIEEMRSKSRAIANEPFD